MILGKNDIVKVKTKTHTSDGRGGVTTAYATKIAAFVCSFQPTRREELRMDLEGQVVVDPAIMLYDNITSGPEIIIGDVVEFNGEDFLVITVSTLSGKGTHTEAILRHVSGDAIVA